MSFMMKIVQQLRTSIDFNKIDFEVLPRVIHPIEQIEFHKQAGEMTYSTLTGKTMVVHQFQNSINNILASYELERASSQAKGTRINSLEDLVIELGHYPKDIKASEQLIKKKSDDITTLKKQLKIPQLQDPQTQEVLESQNKHEELMELVPKLNDQLREIKTQLLVEK